MIARPAVAVLLLASTLLGTWAGGAAGPSYRVEVKPGEVRLLRGPQLVRAYPVAVGQQALALVTNGRLAVATQPERRWDEYQLRVYDVATGRLLTAHMQVGRVSRLYSKGDTLFVQYTSAVAEIATRTWVQSLRVAGKAQDIDGWGVTENERSLLFDSPNGAYNPYEPVRLNYFRHDLATGKTVPLQLAVPTRPGCGPVEKDGTQGEQETYTSQEIVATRHDGCGRYQVRFDWTRDEPQPVSVTPLE